MSAVKVCRVCLSECAELTPLWVQLPGENKTLEDAINFVANINIKLENGLPDKICKTCESVLDLADTFKQRCLESESILEQQAQEKQSDEFQLKYEKNHQENSEIYSEDTSCLPTSISHTLPTDSIREKTDKAENIYDLPVHKIKIEIEDLHVDAGLTKSDQGNLDTTEYEVPIEDCFIKEEFSAKTIKYPDNQEIFSCPHCSLTFQTKLSYKLHVLFTHSTSIHTKGAPSLTEPKLDDMQPTTAEVRSATEDPAAADTSTARIIGINYDFQKAENSHVIKEISNDKMKKESTKDTVLKLSGTKTDDKITCATEKQSECFNSTVIGTTGDILTCDVCGYTTAAAISLDSHLKAHAAPKRYSCDSCLYITVTSEHFNRHKRTHTDHRPYSCDVCKKKFRQKYHFVTHLRTHTGEKPFSCNLCERRFSDKSYLVKHLRTHTGETPYSCNICEKKFNQKNHLSMHLKQHTGDKPYSCGVCGKQFIQKQNLFVHERTHTGEKPYCCNVCQRQFTSTPNLVKHMRTHTDEKPHSCEVCEKQFSLKSYLLKHMKTHTGERSYTCEVCGKQFTQICNLGKHMRKHTG